MFLYLLRARQGYESSRQHIHSGTGTIFFNDFSINGMAGFESQGVDALNRVAFDAVARTIRSRSPISLPIIAPVTEEEDLKNIENLRQIMAVLNRSSATSAPGTVASMTAGGNAATSSSTNFRTTTQVYSWKWSN